MECTSTKKKDGFNFFFCYWKSFHQFNNSFLIRMCFLCHFIFHRKIYDSMVIIKIKTTLGLILSIHVSYPPLQIKKRNPLNQTVQSLVCFCIWTSLEENINTISKIWKCADYSEDNAILYSIIHNWVRNVGNECETAEWVEVQKTWWKNISSTINQKVLVAYLFQSDEVITLSKLIHERIIISFYYKQTCLQK